MRWLIQLLTVLALIALGVLVLIKITYKCSWRDSVGIADQFIAELLG